MSGREITTQERGGAPQRPEIVWTRAARVRVGIEPVAGDAKSVYLPGLIADLLELVRSWTGYPTGAARRDELRGQAKELRRRISRASPDTLAEARARAERLRAGAEPALRCVLDFVFAGEHARSRADAADCLSHAVVPGCAEMLLGSLDAEDLVLRIVQGRLRVDFERGVCARALEIVLGLGSRAVPALDLMFGVLAADRREERDSTTRAYHRSIRRGSGGPAVCASRGSSRRWEPSAPRRRRRSSRRTSAARIYGPSPVATSAPSPAWRSGCSPPSRRAAARRGTWLARCSRW